MEIRTKRIYDEASSTDGMRVLVDRIWPRGMSKERAAIDLWIKTLAPTDELRKWYQHDHEKWPEFLARYHAELDDNSIEYEQFLGSLEDGVVSLVFSSRETEFNNAAALKIYMEQGANATAETSE